MCILAIIILPTQPLPSFCPHLSLSLGSHASDFSSFSPFSTPGEYGLPGYDEIVVISNERVNGKEIGLNGLDSNLSKDGRRHFWHSDLSYMAMPPLGSMLHAKKLPESGDGDTLFCDMYQAYETLDPVLQEEIEGLQAYHCFWRHARLDVLKQQMQLRKKVSGIMQAVPEVVST